jgi:uncharacterized protein YbjQ (UPF0145 family)
MSQSDAAANVHGDTPPAEPDTTPAQPDTTPAQPDTTPAQPDTTPAQPDTTPAQPDTTPAQPETTAAEDGTPQVAALKTIEAAPQLFPGDDRSAADRATDAGSEPNAAAFDTSTEPSEQTHENYELALPSTPEPRVEISAPIEDTTPANHEDDPASSGGSQAARAAATGHGDEIEAGWSVDDQNGVDRIETPDPDEAYGDDDLASIADEISSLSDVLAEAEDLELTEPDPDIADEDLFDIDGGLDDSSVLAAISELDSSAGADNAEIADTPDITDSTNITDSLEIADAPEITDSTNITDSVEITGGAQDPAPGAPQTPIASMDFPLSLNTQPAHEESSPAERSTLPPSAGPAWTSGLGSGSSLFGDPAPPPAAAPAGGTPGDAPAESDDDLTHTQFGPAVDQHDEGRSDVAGTSVSESQADPSPRALDGPDSTRVAQEPESITAVASDRAADNESDLHALAGAGIPATDIPDDMPSWAVDYDGARAGSTPAPASPRHGEADAVLPANGLADTAPNGSITSDRSGPGPSGSAADPHDSAAAPEWDDPVQLDPGEPQSVPDAAGPSQAPDDPWVPPAESGLDRPYTSQPVPSAYKELENLPPPLVTGREPESGPSVPDTSTGGDDAKAPSQATSPYGASVDTPAPATEAGSPLTPVPEGSGADDGRSEATTLDEAHLYDPASELSAIDRPVAEDDPDDGPAPEIASAETPAAADPATPGSAPDTPSLTPSGDALAPTSADMADDGPAPADASFDGPLASDLALGASLFGNPPAHWGSIGGGELGSSPDTTDEDATSERSVDTPAFDLGLTMRPEGAPNDAAGDLDAVLDAGEPERADERASDPAPAPAAEGDPRPVLDPMSHAESTAPGDSRWASKWAESAQGWVVGSDGETAWRPIVATSAALDGWDAETYLGLVSGEAVVANDLASGRAAAIARMVEEGLARGAHALVGVSVSYHSVADRQVAVATGTAVTLTPAD